MFANPKQQCLFQTKHTDIPDLPFRQETKVNRKETFNTLITKQVSSRP